MKRLLLGFSVAGFFFLYPAESKAIATSSSPCGTMTFQPTINYSTQCIDRFYSNDPWFAGVKPTPTPGGKSPCQQCHDAADKGSADCASKCQKDTQGRVDQGCKVVCDQKYQSFLIECLLKYDCLS